MDGDREWALIGAARNGSLEQIKAHLSSGVDINCQDDEDGRTPLYRASCKGHTDIVEYLLKCKADPNIRDEDGRTPLHRACVIGSSDIVKVLLKYNADPNISDKNGRTPLYKASYLGRTDIVKVLLKYNADPNISDKYQETPLHKACHYGHVGILQCLVENGISIKARDKNGSTPIDYLKRPGYNNSVTQDRRACLEWLNRMGYLEDASTVLIADISTEVTSTTRSIDNMDYGLSLDIDPSSLSSNSTPVLADIKVYTVKDDDDKVPFTFPSETKPMSAIYSISLQSVPVCTLKIRHCADPNNPEELEHLTFVKSLSDSSSDSSSKFEVVPGGIFKPGKNYGEISLSSHISSWSIVEKIVKTELDEEPKATRYVGTILYQTVKHHPDQWLMQLMAAKHDPTSTLALNEYITNKCSHNADWKVPEEFLFTFEDTNNKPKLGLTTRTDERVLKCSNGWEISLEMYEISQDTVDRFKRSSDVPGRCSLKIHTHMNVCHELALLPSVTLSGIVSDKKDIIINPPIPDSAAEFETDYTNVQLQLKGRDTAPTLEAVFDLMKRYSARWNEFGIALRILHNDRQILYNERISAEARLERIIYHWIESECSPVTWDYLSDVLRRMGLKDLIDIEDSESKTELTDKPHSGTNKIESESHSDVCHSNTSTSEFETQSCTSLLEPDETHSSTNSPDHDETHSSASVPKPKTVPMELSATGHTDQQQSKEDKSKLMIETYSKLQPFITMSIKMMEGIYELKNTSDMAGPSHPLHSSLSTHLQEKGVTFEFTVKKD